ncbi:MAG: TonB-dependent receptor [Myxococcales bacterium]|nr:TonB-dependent receptor [Myxococcales bacterium]
MHVRYAPILVALVAFLARGGSIAGAQETAPETAPETSPNDPGASSKAPVPPAPGPEAGPGTEDDQRGKTGLSAPSSSEPTPPDASIGGAPGAAPPRSAPAPAGPVPATQEPPAAGAPAAGVPAAGAPVPGAPVPGAPVPGAPRSAPGGQPAPAELEALELSPEDLAELEAEALTGSAPEVEGAEPGAESPGLRLQTLSILGTALDALEASGSAHVVEREELERFEQDDIHRVLRRAPGVYVRGEDGFGLRPNIGIRGVTSDRSKKVTLLEDRVLLGPAPYSAPAAYFFPVVTRMTGVEVFKGPAAIAHGPQTIGGAVNLLTRSIPGGEEGELDLAAGMFGYRKAHGYYGYGGERWGLLLEGVALQSTGFKELGGNGAQDNTGFDKQDLMLKLRHSSPATADVFHQVDLKLGFGTETSYETYLGVTLDDFGEDAFQRYSGSQRGKMEWWRLLGEFSYLVAFGEDVQVHTTLYRHDFDRAWEKLNRFGGGTSLDNVLKNPGGGNELLVNILRGDLDSDPSVPEQVLLVGTNDRRYVSQGVQTVVDLALDLGPMSHQIEFGARLHYDQVVRDEAEDGYLMSAGVLVPTDQPEHQTADNRGRTLAGAVYARDEISVGPLKLTPGMRVELFESEFKDRETDTEGDRFASVLIPGLGVYYRLFEQLGVLAGAYRGFSNVTPGPHLLEANGAEVEPETAINVEAGARYADETLRAELIGFHSEYDNILGECSNRTLRPPLCTPETIGLQFNAGRARVRGLEAVVGYAAQGPVDLTFGVDASYTLTLSEFLDEDIVTPDFGEVEPGHSMPYMPIHQGALSGRVEHPVFGVALSARYLGEMRDVAGTGEPPDNERIDGNLILDVSAYYHATPADRIYLKIDNLLAQDYIASWRPFGARPGKPFSLQLGYKHHFGM